MPKPRTPKPKPPAKPPAHDDGEALARAVLAQMWEGLSLVRIARLRGTSRASLHRLLDKHITADDYARAREAQGDYYAEQIDEIRERVTAGEMDPNAARIAIDSLKWQAAKFHRNRYGDKVELSGDAERPVEVRHRWRFGDQVVEF